MTAKPLKLSLTIKDVGPLLKDSLQDDEATEVMHDWIREQATDAIANIAHDMWMATRPTKFQQEITLAVIGPATRLDHYPDAESLEGGIAEFKAAFYEAHRQLKIHRHAKWTRYIRYNAQTGPRLDEVMLDRMGQETECDHRGKPVLVHRFRARCRVAGCIMSSSPTVLFDDEIQRTIFGNAE